ncbi:Mu transposase C-terminal domain-containing protein [Leifsonia sp. NPDC056665]|uniref:Mu transposase C-terminal domain-containing protein n=1 Tax=Leifsonia sp. NPDC056665 TaxID=3345901 RepID=UPI0036C71AF2
MTNSIRWTRLGSTVVLTDGDYVISEITHAGLKLRSKKNRECRVVSIGELPSLLDPVANPPERILADVRVMDHLDARQSEAISKREAHLREVLDGTPLPGRDRRPEFDPEYTSLETRVQRKAVELANAGVPSASARTLKRQIAILRDDGPVGLVDHRAGRSERAFARADIRVIDAMIEIADRQTNRSNLSRQVLEQEISKILAKRFPGEVIPRPGKSARNTYWNLITHGKYTFGDSQTRRTAANAPERMFQPRRALMPGAEAQIDTTNLDIFVKGWNGKPMRVVLAILIDKATRSIIAAVVMPVAMKGADLTLLLARALVPPKQRPTHPIDPQEIATVQGLEFLTTEDAARAEAARPYIVPRMIDTDLGADYMSATFRSALEQRGISVVRSSVRTPTDKAIVERAFRTIKDNFLPYGPGFTGGAVNKRGQAPENDDGLLDIYTLQTYLDRFIAIVYQNTVTEGLRDPYDPSIELSPNAAYLSMYDFTGAFPIPLGPDDYISMLPVKRQCILRDGITVNYRRYDSEALNPLREQYDTKTRKSRRWDIHWDPYDPQAVWVEDPDTGTWIKCDWMDQDALSDPFDREIRANARKIRATTNLLSRAESHRLAASLVEGSKRAQREKDRMEVGNELRKSLGVPTPNTSIRRRRPPTTAPVIAPRTRPGRFEPWRDEN